MVFVLDACVTASWGLADELSPFAERVEDRLQHDSALVPHIWWYEIRNILLTGERRGRLTPSDSSQFLNLLSSYPIAMEPLDDSEATFRLARDFRLSFYDAAYLELAQRYSIPLATTDRALRSAAESAGVTLLD